MICAKETQLEMNQTNTINSSRHASSELPMDTDGNTSNMIGKIGTTNDTNDGWKEQQNEVKCNQCNQSEILAQYKTIVEGYQEFTNEIQDLVQEENTNNDNDCKVISAIREALGKLGNLDLSIIETTDNGVEISTRSPYQAESIFEQDDRSISTEDKLFNEIEFNMPNSNQSVEENDIFKGGQLMQTIAEDSINDDIHHDDNDKENLNDMSMSFLLDDASVASKEKRIPLRRSARRKSLAPICYNADYVKLTTTTPNRYSSSSEEWSSRGSISPSIGGRGKKKKKEIKIKNKKIARVSNVLKPSIASEKSIDTDLKCSKGNDIMIKPIKEEEPHDSNRIGNEFTLDLQDSVIQQINSKNGNCVRQSYPPSTSTQLKTTKSSPKQIDGGTNARGSGVKTEVFGLEHSTLFTPMKENRLRRSKRRRTISVQSCSILDHPQSLLEKMSPTSTSIPKFSGIKYNESKSIPLTSCNEAIDNNSFTSNLAETPSGVTAKDKVHDVKMTKKAAIRRSKRRRTISVQGGSFLVQPLLSKTTAVSAPIKKECLATTNRESINTIATLCNDVSTNDVNNNLSPLTVEQVEQIPLGATVDEHRADLVDKVSRKGTKSPQEKSGKGATSSSSEHIIEKQQPQPLLKKAAALSALVEMVCPAATNSESINTLATICNDVNTNDVTNNLSPLMVELVPLVVTVDENRADLVDKVSRNGIKCPQEKSGKGITSSSSSSENIAKKQQPQPLLNQTASVEMLCAATANSESTNTIAAICNDANTNDVKNNLSPLTAEQVEHIPLGVTADENRADLVDKVSKCPQEKSGKGATSSSSSSESITEKQQPQPLLNQTAATSASVEMECPATTNSESINTVATPCNDVNTNDVTNNLSPLTVEQVEHIPLGVTTDENRADLVDEVSRKETKCSQEKSGNGTTSSSSSSENITKKQQGLRRSQRRRTIAVKGGSSLLQPPLYQSPLSKIPQHSSTQRNALKPKVEENIGFDVCPTSRENCTSSSVFARYSSNEGTNKDNGNASTSILEVDSLNTVPKGRIGDTMMDSVEVSVDAIGKVKGSKIPSLKDVGPKSSQLPTRRSRRKKLRSKRYRDYVTPILAEDEVSPSVPKNKTPDIETRPESAAVSNMSPVYSPKKSNFVADGVVLTSMEAKSSLPISKQKRRRRSTLGLHVGGMITVNDITAIEKESAARKRKRCVQKDPINRPSKVKVENTNIGEVDRNDTCIERNYIIPSAEEIKECIMRLFNRDGVVEKPCMSARIFACLYLITSRQKSITSNITDSLDALDPTLTNPLQPILPLLQALVYAELASFGDKQTNEGSNKKRLHFCSFNYSTIITPVDIVVGSNKMIEGCIASIFNAVQEMETLRTNIISQEKIDHILTLVSNLEVFEGEEVQISKECSKTMPFPWPISRFSDASKHYRSEIRAAISGNLTTNDNSSLKKHLGELIGRAIRFYLRQFFNPVPYPPSSTESENHFKIEGAKVRSRVHSIIAMKEEGSDICTAAADGSISSVFGLALRSIHEFFEFNDSKKIVGSDAKYCTSFCQRNASQKCASDSIKMTDEDVEEVLLDITDAHIVLSGIRACTFIKELLNWPGVSEAIADIGGWMKVEYFAKMYAECRLHFASPDEKYVMLLENIDQLVRRLHDDAKTLKCVEKECEDSLKTVWKRFRCGANGKKKEALLRKYPYIEDINIHLRAGTQTRFPSFIAAPRIE